MGITPATTPLTDERTEELAAFGQALSDPIRITMLSMMAAGRECCSIPDCGVPERDKDAGICVCEFERAFDLAQSKVSYHMKKLKDAGLVEERKRGRWNYYSVNRKSLAKMTEDLRKLETPLKT